MFINTTTQGSIFFSGSAWALLFNNGGQGGRGDKTFGTYVRAFRKFAV